MSADVAPDAGTDRSEPGPYFIDFSKSHVPSPYGPMDPGGLPLWDPSSMRLPGKPIHHPVIISQYGLAQHQLLLDGDAAAEGPFLACVRWVEEHGVPDEHDRFLVWPYTFPLRTPRIKPPWISGMAQGQVLSLLARAYALTGSSRTADVARRTGRSFCYTIQEGGVVSEAPTKSLFIEEVAHSPAIHVLNGALYGLYGLYEYTATFDDPELLPVLDACVEGVEEALPLFDMGWWSRYSLGLRFHMAPPYYHDVHVQQLRSLARILDRPTYARYAERWDAQQRTSTLRLRRAVLGVIEVNVNRLLTIAGLDRIKYRRVPSLGE
jgi:hypothetical protein